MKEELLHYVWKSKNIDFHNLKTTQGDSVEILNFGNFNHNAGPDFLDAKIKIENTLWAGHVEMHVNAADWHRHGHQNDPAYNNVILHVVWKEDKKAVNEKNIQIPCIEICRKVDPQLVKKYKNLISSQLRIPCEKNLTRIDNFTIQYWLQRISLERLEEKVNLLGEELSNLNNNWEQLMFVKLAYGLGLKVNCDAFTALARSIDIQILKKHRDSPFQIEALLFGQAGLLSSRFKDAYPSGLLKEYEYLRHKYHVQAIPKNWWKFMRLRPANFPTIRIAQLARLIQQKDSLFSFVVEENIEDVIDFFGDIGTSDYWDSHYIFDKTSKTSKKKKIGKSRKNILIINSIVPIVFAYGWYQNDQILKDKAIQILEKIKPEKNKIINMWESIQIKAVNASESQALIQLKNNYCDKKRCLECSIGNTILSLA